MYSLRLLSSSPAHLCTVRMSAAGWRRSRDVTASSSVKFPLDSLVSIRLDNPKDFLQAVEIEISLYRRKSGGIRTAFALSLYKNVTPQPDKTDTSYFADQVTSVLLPSSTKFYLRVPVNKDHTLKALFRVQPSSMSMSRPRNFPLCCPSFPS